MPPPAPESAIPITLLTGFLGSGKTTILNHLLRQQRLPRIAVIVNELGAIAIDHLLVQRSSESLLELADGCICCTIRSDLAATLFDLFVQRVDRRIASFERVVIETTGLADPAPILFTLLTDPMVAGRYRIDGIATAVDAAVGGATLDRQPEALRQAAVADRLLLTKTDIADPAAVRALRGRLAALNPGTPIVEAVDGAVDPADLLGIGSFDLAAKPAAVQRWVEAAGVACRHEEGHGHRHDGAAHDRHGDGIATFSATRDQPIAWEAFRAWVQRLQEACGGSLLRAKGIVGLAERPDRPIVFHAVQDVFHPPVELPAWPTPERRSLMVLILRDGDAAAAEALLRAFAGRPAAPRSGPG